MLWLPWGHGSRYGSLVFLQRCLPPSSGVSWPPLAEAFTQKALLKAPPPFPPWFSPRTLLDRLNPNHGARFSPEMLPCGP